MGAELQPVRVHSLWHDDIKCSFIVCALAVITIEIVQKCHKVERTNSMLRQVHSYYSNK